MEEKIHRFLNEQETLRDDLMNARESNMRFKLSLDRLRDYDSGLAKYVIKHPVKAIQFVEARLNQILNDSDSTNDKIV